MPTTVIDLSTLTAGDGFVIKGKIIESFPEYDQLGNSVSNAGDVNGDGIDDLIVGTSPATFGEDGFTGGAYVIFGRPTETRGNIDVANFAVSDGFHIKGVIASGGAGRSVSTAGDINGDGFDDLLVGALFDNYGGYRSGDVFVIFGKAGATRSDIDLSNLDNPDIFVIQGAAEQDRTGASVSTAGDINGDGFDDIIIGSPGFPYFYGRPTNEAYVIYGKPGATRDSINLATFSASDGFAIRGENTGGSVSDAGDINGDGIDDLIIGGNGNTGPAAFVIFGKTGATRSNIDLDNLSASDGFAIKGISGSSVSSAGDVNGDGFDDVIIGSSANDFAGEVTGAAFIVFGKQGATRSTVFLTALSAGDGFAILGETQNDKVGNSVSGAGDINGDGIDDVIIGAYGHDDDGQPSDLSYAGAAYVILGKAGATRSTIDLANLDVSDGFIIQQDPLDPAKNRSRTGSSVSSAGDINGDGIDDVIVGAPGIANEDRGVETSRAYVIYGNTGFGLLNQPPIAGDDSASTPKDQPAQIAESTLLVNDSDADGDVLIVSAVANPTNGTVSLSGSTITFTPTAGFSGTGGFDYTVSDGKGGSDTAHVTVNVSSTNLAPVALPVTATATEDGALVTGQLAATDPDGDALTFSVVLTGQFAPGVAGLTINPDGSYSFDPSHADYQKLAAGEVIDLLAGYFVSDGQLTDDSTLTITLTGANDAPALAATQAVNVSYQAQTAVTVAATDIDGDVLSYTSASPAHGSVSGGAGGAFTYTPAAGFLGSDSFTVTVSDGNGAFAVQTVNVQVTPPLANQFSLFVQGGFAGGVGGSGKVFGTATFQSIAVIDEPGSIALDPSFNRGGDILHLTGNASSWSIIRVGSSALLSDGDTFVTVPVGTAGIAVVFDDGARALKFDAGSGSFTIGGQAFASGTLVPVDAAPDGTVLPIGADPAAKGVLFLAAGAGVSAAGVIDIFGTSSPEPVRLISGNITFDPSFNRGGDTIAFDETASDFLASRNGSSVFLDGSDTDALIPVGTSGATLAFGDGSDTRSLLLDTGIPAITIGGQQIGLDPVQLMAA